jgi:S1-C subfamily serine protease
VTPGSPADAAGLRAGDVIRRVGQAPAASVIAVRRLLALGGGDGTFLVIERDSVLRGVQLQRDGRGGKEASR